MAATLVAAMVVVLVFLAGAPVDALGQGLRGNRVVEPGTRVLTAGVPAYWPPQYSLDQNGRPAGFAIDVMDAVADLAGLEIRYKVFDSFAQVMTAIREGEVDIIPNLGVVSGRLEELGFTSPVETFVVSVFVREDDHQTRSLADLAGRRVATVRMNIGSRIVGSYPELQNVVHADARSALFDLLAGRSDALVFPAPIVANMAKAIGIDSRIKAVGKPLLEVKRAIAVRGSETDLLATLEWAVTRFVGSPRYQDIYLKWYGGPLYWTAARVLWILGPLLLAALLAMAWWRYRSILVLNRKLNESVSAAVSAQTAIRASEERFRDFAETASDWLWELDSQYRFTMYTGARASSGFDQGDVCGKTRWHALGVDPTKRIWREHRADLEARRPIVDFEFDYRDPTGLSWTLRINGKPFFGPDGAFLGYRGTSTDITARKRVMEALRENERLLREVIDGMPFAFHLWDREERLVMCNSTQHAWFPHLRDAMRVGFAFEDSVRCNVAQGKVDYPSDDIEGYVRQRLEVFRNPERYPNEQIRVAERWIRVINKKLPDGRTISIRLDVTDARAAEERLRQSQKMEAVGQLTGGLAHDFNNLLGVILGNAEILGDQLGSEGKRADAVIRAAERGAELTQRLLSFSRKQALQPRVLDLAANVASMIDLLRRTLGEAIEIETFGAADLWRCEADPGQLESALLNLAVNARDAMPGGGKLTIETVNVVLEDDDALKSAEVPPGPYVMLAVSDSGTGIAAENLPHVFEPFFTTKDVGQGSGLGLSMVYGFTKQSGGHIAIDSEVGLGTTVKLYLPKVTDALSEAPAPGVAEPLRARDEVVLVVEDDPDLLALTVSHLASLGYRTLGASDGTSGLATLNETPRIDLLLTDVVLPGGHGGPQLARQARQSHKGIRVLFMSGYTEDAIMRDGQFEEGPMLLQKPFRRADIARAVRQALDMAPA